MAGWDPTMMTPTLYTSNGGGQAAPTTSGGGQPHHGLIGIVLVSVLGLFLLDRAGIKFFVTAGKR